MLKRKFLTLIFSLFFSISIIAFWFVITEEELVAFFPMALFISLIALPAIILYGFPVSLLSEKLTKKLSNHKRNGMSFIIHIVFGLAFVFLAGVLFETRTLFTDFSQFWRSYEVIFIASIVTSICFWGVDEGFRNCPLIKSKN